jgi:AhpD family alkylhydroperoxidase
MSFIDTPDRYAYAWYIRPILWLLRRKTGQLSAAVRLWGRIPGAFLGFLWMWRSLERKSSPLDAQLQALIRTRISQLDGCAFCINLNGSRALALGVSEDTLVALPEFAESPLFDAPAKTALTFAEAITVTGRKVDAELVAQLKQHYSDAAIIELAAVIAHQNLSAKFNTALGVDP